MMAEDPQSVEESTGEPGSFEVSEDAIEALTEAAHDGEEFIHPVRFGPLPGLSPELEGHNNLDLLLDIDIPISVEVGRAELSLNEILKLVPGSIVRLDKKVEDPVDLCVNGKLVARGEVVMVDDSYGLRITRIVDTVGRLESLK